MERITSLNRSNLEYIESLYQAYLEDPESSDPQWRLFFEGVEFAQKLPGKSQFSAQELSVYNLIEHYRDYGHLKASLDPLDLSKPDTASFDLAKFGLKPSDLDQTFAVGAILGSGRNEFSPGANGEGRILAKHGPGAPPKDVLPMRHVPSAGDAGPSEADLPIPGIQWYRSFV